MGSSKNSRWLSAAAVGAVVVWSVVQTVGFTHRRCCPGRALPYVTVPTFIGWDVEHARRLADSLGLTTSLDYRRGRFLHRPNTVLDQMPHEGELPAGAAVTFAVSRPESRSPAAARAATVARVPVSSRRDVVRTLRELGFFEVAVLSIGTPTEIKVYRIGHLHVKTRYEARGRPDVVLTQSNGYARAYGRLVRVRRSYEGVLQRDALFWVERGYALSVSPPGQRYATALSWRRSMARRDAMEWAPSATRCCSPSAS